MTGRRVVATLLVVAAIAIALFWIVARRGTPRPDPKTRLTAAVNADLATAAREFIAGRSSLQQYIFVMRDRTGKYARWEQDSTWRDEYANGDSDGDLVPDARDRCRDTRPLAITDANGCEIECRGRPDDPCGDHVPPPDTERGVRDLLDSALVLVNPRCDGAPTPTMPEPLEWGRGAQSRIKTIGFNFSITRVANQPAECEVFYELDVQLTGSARAGDPPVRYVSVLFKGAENLVPGDPRRVVFGIPGAAGFPGVTWTPGRTGLQDALNYYRVVTWRVRAVNGAQRASNWSAPRVQQASAAGVTA